MFFFGVENSVFTLKLIENGSNLKYRNLQNIFLLLSPHSYFWQIDGFSSPPQE